MGDVYQATNTKLRRSVAIKFLPHAFSHDTERVARFQREARVLASLNHSNIAAIHGLEEIDKCHFLVMELVPGETLADRIQRGAIPLAEAISIARQIADALRRDAWSLAGKNFDRRAERQQGQRRNLFAYGSGRHGSGHVHQHNDGNQSRGPRS
jgi:serine/threonine protein kinase